MASTNWNITDGSFKSVRFHVAIPKKNYTTGFGAVSQEVVTERRLQISDKALIDGSQVEDFGRKARTFNAEVVFFGNDYRNDLATFEKTLNKGTSGKLILPDLDEVVWAKFQRQSRKTTAQDGGSTILSISWIEDIDNKGNLLDDLNSKKKSISTIEKFLADTHAAMNAVQDLALGTQDLIANNVIISAIKEAESLVTTARVTINSVTNISRNTREMIISLEKSLTNTITGLHSAVDGIREMVDQLKNKFTKKSATQYNSNLSALDFKNPSTTTSTSISNDQKVNIITTTKTQVQDNKEAVKLLKDFAKSIRETQKTLEAQTQGATKDVTLGGIQLVNQINDLIALLNNESTTQVVTMNNTSLLEVCFENGKTINDIDDVYELNRNLTDILDIPRYTVINL